MKLIVYVLSALLLFSCVSAGGSSSKQDVTADLQTDSDLQHALKYGINWVFQQAANKYSFSDLNVDVTGVNSIQKWEDNGATYYDCNGVEAQNDYANVTATYEVKCDKNGDLSVVNQWSYNIDQNKNNQNTDTENEETNCDTNVEIDVEVDIEVVVEEEAEQDTNPCAQGNEVDASDVDNDSDLKNALNYGVDWIFQQAANKYGISGNDVTVNQINLICKWEDNGNTYYSFDVEACNNDANINATYSVKCNNNGDDSIVNKWSYNIDKTNNNQESDNNTDENTDNEVNIEVVVEEEADNNPCSQGDQVDASDVDNDSDLKNALNYGVDWIFQQAANKYGISDKDVTVNQINLICKWEDNGNTYYSFDVEACNNDANINATYNVKCNNNGDDSVVNKWSYNIDKTNNNQETDNNTDENTDNEVNIEVTVEEEDNNKCENIDASQIDCNSDLKNALNHGIDWIYQQANDKFGISTDDITVTKVNNLCGWEDNGSNYYSFNVEATNNNGDTVTASFNVRCDSNGDLRVVNEWSYNIQYGNKEEENNNENCEDQGTDTSVNLENDIEVNVEVTISKCQQGEEVDASDVNNDSDLKDALTYGIGWIFQNAANKYGVSDDSVDVTQINCICKWEDNGCNYYYFDVGANNNNDASVNATYNVKDDDGSFNVVNKWWYHISYQSDNNDQSDDCGNPQDENNNTYEDNGEDVNVEIDCENNN